MALFGHPDIAVEQHVQCDLLFGEGVGQRGVVDAHLAGLAGGARQQYEGARHARGEGQHGGAPQRPEHVTAARAWGAARQPVRIQPTWLSVTSHSGTASVTVGQKIIQVIDRRDECCAFCCASVFNQVFFDVVPHVGLLN